MGINQNLNGLSDVGLQGQGLPAMAPAQDPALPGVIEYNATVLVVVVLGPGCILLLSLLRVQGRLLEEIVLLSSPVISMIGRAMISKGRMGDIVEC